MQLPKHILVATDFSATSREAVEAAAAFAQASKGKVTLVHVFDPAPMVPPAAIPAPRRMEAQIEKEMASKIHAELEAVRAGPLSDVPDVSIAVLKHPNPAHALCERAAEDGADLVIVGTHGRTGLSHLLIGSVAERVVRYAPCPVLAVRPTDGGRAPVA
jgi:nucleotide-binding universal stress UspA family protein